MELEVVLLANNGEIRNLASKLIKQHCTSDPFELCKALGVEVMFMDLGGLKGMYKYFQRNRFAAINENLDENSKKIVCAHELGHDLFHKSLAKKVVLQEFMLYDMKSRPEYEANLFASEILLPDNEIFTFAKEGYDIQQIAGMLYTDVNLVAIKVASMNANGYELKKVMDVRADFLKK
jgi:Zn-dependent peptidase ImmA (M78 family)